MVQLGDLPIRGVSVTDWRMESGHFYQGAKEKRRHAQGGEGEGGFRDDGASSSVMPAASESEPEPETATSSSAMPASESESEPTVANGMSCVGGST